VIKVINFVHKKGHAKAVHIGVLCDKCLFPRDCSSNSKTNINLEGLVVVFENYVPEVEAKPPVPFIREFTRT
jgi:hypothetical protein